MHTIVGSDSVLLAFIIWIVVGAIIGWLAGLLVQGGGFGFVLDALIGILGSVVAGWLFPRLGFTLGGGLIGAILASVIGAVIVAVAVRLLRRI
ncbi:GlsB/YeaQ/YmgE family stress response membrane protein [Sphingomonas sp. BIUV-7]|uniref:GlsB/YeaQ/YmgE family stress response membrane protein n=1 Tax=Sphingomonas natans TaxID=3063330 RepID=A0ABT8YDK3_9SPHN|nr:GlsB/YeaQ/YmgE family stress response membrane protein [Sphingomonas sp. BIUV-7]MDO6416410.1 GlsB/YeaQ/YmgE family stress response membrane protein [Sphingomonas sp. BIUV-7]